VAGRYYKMFPTVGEIEKGIVPGKRVIAYETDFGRVAMIICFDLTFPKSTKPLWRRPLISLCSRRCTAAGCKRRRSHTSKARL
jgi:predicted amidohydrolase